MSFKEKLDATEPEHREAILLAEVRALEKVDHTIDGYHPLFWSCYIESIRALRELAEMNPDPNYLNEDGTTALVWAPNAEYTNILTLLGAKVSSGSGYLGNTALHMAAAQGQTDQIRILMQQSDGSTCIERLNDFGQTPLACATDQGRVDAVRLLLKFGANSNNASLEETGPSILQTATRRGYVLISRLLLEAGADPCLSPNLDDTPINLAHQQGIYRDLEGFFKRESCLPE